LADQTSPINSSTLVYTCQQTWNPDRPHALVIACSDGRLQQNVDEFLQNHLGIVNYDRMYVPGGPGALANSGYEFLRPDQLRRETAFLLTAHQIRDVILIFHSAADDGPPEATCADYRRKLPNRTPEELNAHQISDVPDLLRLFSWPPHLRVLVYRAEVTGSGEVQFVDLTPTPTNR
jgi:hypothetical protein